MGAVSLCEICCRTLSCTPLLQLPELRLRELARNLFPSFLKTMVSIGLADAHVQPVLEKHSYELLAASY